MTTKPKRKPVKPETKEAVKRVTNPPTRAQRGKKKATKSAPDSATHTEQKMKSSNPSITATERLIEHRTATLDLYRRLSDVRAKAGKPIPETIAQSHENLDQNRFLLAIVGKVKAGKSTFINALLGKDLLPTDALQATAAIIEIFHAEKPSLRVTYANEATEEVFPNEGDDSLAPLTEKLREVAAIRDKYRDLPIAQLNDFIIQRYNRETTKAEWEPEILTLFLQNELPNIHKIPTADLQQRSRNYLESYRDGKAVAMRIEVGYPHAYEFNHFRIVDTPGICAKGGFAQRTLAFMIKADGVIYLHKEEPAEDTLHDALQNVIPEKAKKHMLLVLTHKCDHDDEENEKFLAETHRCCSQIQPERVFLVDSLTERALQSFYDLKTWEDISEFRKQESKTHRSWRRVTAGAFEDAGGNRSEFFELLEKQSNMRSMKKEILRMSEKSLGIQIESLLGAIQELYAELAADAEARRDGYSLKLKDPQKFAADIKKQMEEMDELEAQSSARIASIQRKFDLDNPRQEFGKNLKKKVSEAEAEINGKEFSSEDTAKTADNFLMKINQDVDDSLQTLVGEMKSTFHQMIVEMETSLQADFNITVPKIPLIEMLEIVKSEATEKITTTVYGKGFLNRVLQIFSFGFAGKETKEERKFDATKYFAGAKTNFVRELWARKQQFADSVKTNIQRAADEYRASVHRKLKDRKDLFEDLQSRKLVNDDVQKCFDAESAQLEAAKLEIKECVRIRGDL